MGIHTEQQAKQRVIELVQCTKASVGFKETPQYSGVRDPIARHLGITVKEEPLPLGDEGQYIPDDPPTIALDPRINDPERLNFTFFHEITHHLVYRDNELYSFLHEYASTNDEHFETALESYCNIGAAEFLIPAEDVRTIIKERGFGIALIEQLEPLYPASKPAIAIQLAQCATHKCFVVICAWGIMPHRQRPPQTSYFSSVVIQPQLHTVYASSSPSTGYLIGRYVPVPSDHVIAAAYQSRSMVKGTAPILFRSGNRRWRCECEAFYYKSRVYAAFNASQPISPDQLRLF